MKGRIIILALALLALPASGAWATVISFSNTVDFSGTDTDAGRTFLALSAGNPNYAYPYSHILTFAPPAASLIAPVEVTISHKGNTGEHTVEFWFLIDGGPGTPIGDLNPSNGVWVDQTFTIPLSLYPSYPATSWTLQLKLRENTQQTDVLWIDKSVLTGAYSDGVAAVPEPASLTLMGLGLGALVLRRRMRG